MVPDAKGRALESAVHAIEATILQTSPGLRENSFSIESRKRVNVDGVHHEIDIWVTAALGKGYTAIFVFECKNWEDAVGKNEIIVFSEKIDAVKAQHGFFVAKSFTKDAEAQALKDQRIKLLTATEHDPANAITPESFHITAPAGAKATVSFHAKGSKGSMDPIPIHATKITLRGCETLLKAYLDSWMQQIYEEQSLGFSTAHLPEGIHPMPVAAERSFGPGECIVNDKEMERVRIQGAFGIHIFRPAVIADYEVSTRGRAIRLAPVVGPNFALETTFVKLDNE